jgi:hypothetical protein
MGTCGRIPSSTRTSSSYDPNGDPRYGMDRHHRHQSMTPKEKTSHACKNSQAGDKKDKTKRKTRQEKPDM